MSDTFNSSYMIEKLELHMGDSVYPVVQIQIQAQIGGFPECRQGRRLGGEVSSSCGAILGKLSPNGVAVVLIE